MLDEVSLNMIPILSGLYGRVKIVVKEPEVDPLSYFEPVSKLFFRLSLPMLAGYIIKKADICYFEGDFTKLIS